MIGLPNLRLSIVQTHNPMAPTSRSAAIASIAVVGLYAIALALLKWIPVNDALALPVMILCMFWFLRKCEPRTRELALHAATQVLVISWVIHLWTLGYEGRNAVFGGILPWSDDYDYYNDALRLVHGSLMEVSSKRPIFPASFGALLRLFDGDLRIPLLLFAVFAAWAIALASSEVWKTHGWRAAIILYSLLLLSEREWAGFVRTEDLGVPFGLIGFALVWRAIAVRRTAPSNARLLAVSGLFALSIGLLSRPGAFFILPALAVWCALRLLPDDSGRRTRLRFFGIAIAALIAGFGVNEAVSYLTAEGLTLSEYPKFAYGLMHHQDLYQLAAAHPQLATLTGSARVHETWRIVADDAIGHPLLVVGGLARSFAELFGSTEGLFGFVWRNPDDIVLENGAAIHASFLTYGFTGPLHLWLKTFGLYSLLNCIAMFLFAAAFVVATVAAIVVMYRRRTDAFGTMLRYAVFGVLASAPFTPPWLTSSHQTQAATIAFLVVVPAVLLAAGPVGTMLTARSRRLALVPVCISASVILAAVLLRAAPSRPPACNPANGHAIELYPSTAVTVAPERTFSFRNKSSADLLFSIRYLKRHNPLLTASLVPFLKDGTTYIAAYDACDGSTKVLVDDAHILDRSERGWQNVSVRPLATPNVMHVVAGQGPANGGSPRQ